MSTGTLALSTQEDAGLIAGVETGSTPAFEDDRRILVVCHNGDYPGGPLGYSVVIRAGERVGDHYHLRREERIVVVSGCAEFLLLDQRAGSGTWGIRQRFVVDRPGSWVRVPPGVAHAVRAAVTPVVLHVLASCEYHPADDVALPLGRDDGPHRRDVPASVCAG